jgi:hypothetical protein
LLKLQAEEYWHGDQKLLTQGPRAPICRG